MRVLDMLGKTYGNLTVIRRDANSVGGQARWVVKCNCPESIEFTVIGNNLRRGNTVSCPHIKSSRGCIAMAETRQKLNEEIETELVGRTFGSITVLSKFRAAKSGTLWLCSCSCGRDNHLLVRTAALRSGSRKGCRFCKADRMSLPTSQGMRNHLLRVYKLQAKRRGLSWELTGEQFDALTQTACHYCGDPPSDKKSNPRFNGAYKCNGIDRKNNDLGYTSPNCLPCCQFCNRAKWTMGYQEFVCYLERVSQFRLKTHAIEISV